MPRNPAARTARLESRQGLPRIVYAPTAYASGFRDKHRGRRCQRDSHAVSRGVRAAGVRRARWAAATAGEAPSRRCRSGARFLPCFSIFQGFAARNISLPIPRPRRRRRPSGSEIPSAFRDFSRVCSQENFPPPTSQEAQRGGDHCPARPALLDPAAKHRRGGADNAAGGTIQRLNPGLATVRPRSKIEPRIIGDCGYPARRLLGAVPSGGSRQVSIPVRWADIGQPRPIECPTPCANPGARSN